MISFEQNAHRADDVTIPWLNQFSQQANKPNNKAIFLNSSDRPNVLLVGPLRNPRVLLKLRISPSGLRTGRHPRSWRGCRSPRCPQTPPGTSWRWWGRNPPCAAPSGREASAASRSSGPWTPAGPPAAATQSAESYELLIFFFYLLWSSGDLSWSACNGMNLESHFGLFVTNFGGSCWSNERMQVFWVFPQLHVIWYCSSRIFFLSVALHSMF